MVTLGHGTSAIGLSDLHIEDTLSNYITGSENKAKPKDSTRQDPSGNSNSSMLVLEGSRANVDVTSPGASLALAFMYIKSNNRLGILDFICHDNIGRLRHDLLYPQLSIYWIP